MDILLGEINLNLWKKNWNEIFWNNEYIFFFLNDLEKLIRILSSFIMKLAYMQMFRLINLM